jgi:hypothetical protein
VPTEAGIKTVVEMTQAELLRSYHKELSRVEFSENQSELAYLLERVGESVLAFFRDFSNTSAREQVVMKREPSGGQGYLSGRKSSTFNYLILPRSELSGTTFEEYRTDKRNRPVYRADEASSFMLSSGYAVLCLYLHPSHQENSEFRYLGRENRNPRAYVIAFAQKPQKPDYLAEYYEMGAKESIRYLVQGFVWIAPGPLASAPDNSGKDEPDQYQIVRMRTSMLVPQQSILKEQITDVHYKKTQFEDNGRQFWLPEEVNVAWVLPDWTFRNTHTYFDYHRFGVQSDYRIGKPKID